MSHAVTPLTAGLSKDGGACKGKCSFSRNKQWLLKYTELREFFLQVGLFLACAANSLHLQFSISEQFDAILAVASFQILCRLCRAL